MTAPGCADPASCLVPSPPGGIDQRRLRLVEKLAGTLMYRVYSLKHGYDSFNLGYGNTRFAPFSDNKGTEVPTLYLGEDELVALLESVFHEVGTSGDRVIYERALRERGLAYVRTPAAFHLVDLRDPALALLGLSRDQLVATDSGHYACTREWAVWLHGRLIRRRQADGLLWHSRKAELVLGSAPREVVVLFGDRVPSTPGAYQLEGPGVRNLLEGEGRLFVDGLAEELEAYIEPLG
ncbi:MAG: RES family NAD+ phosphorylase [Actinomycetota bacterium]|nr:RES family NAD+ phosphorylase [Actinomycetota bacterium]